jgi:alpha-tubulin suppressor-like RCC1 family protein
MEGGSLSRGGFDVGLMSTALSIRNEGLDRNAREAAEQEERFHGQRAGKRRAQPGKLYAFGSGDYGRLGHGDNHPKKTAKLVEILRDKNVTKFACGPRHTLALTAEGAVYSWGYGGDGQLGHGDYQMLTMPAQIKALQAEHIIDLSCGEKHSMVLTSGGARGGE